MLISSFFQTIMFTVVNCNKLKNLKLIASSGDEEIPVMCITKVLCT